MLYLLTILIVIAVFRNNVNIASQFDLFTIYYKLHTHHIFKLLFKFYIYVYIYRYIYTYLYCYLMYHLFKD